MSFLTADEKPRYCAGAFSFRGPSKFVIASPSEAIQSRGNK
jgi:hypothetical protein